MSRPADAPPEPADPSGPPAVSRFEYNLLRLLRFAVGHMPIEQALGLIAAKQVPPPCLSAVCVKLAEQTLATAGVLALVKGGGWRADTFLTGEGNHHSYFEAEERGVNVLYAGHYATETVGVRALAEHLAARFGLEAVFLDHPTGL